MIDAGDLYRKAKAKRLDFESQVKAAWNPQARSNVTMIDIETAGLGKDAPILQYGSYKGGVKAEMDVFPFSISRDENIWEGGEKTYAGTYAPSYKDVLDPAYRAEFRDKYKGWYLRDGKDTFGVDQLLKDLDTLETNGNRDAIAKIRQALLREDSFTLADIVKGTSAEGLVGNTKLYGTPIGLAKTVSSDILKSEILMAQNMPFESLRLGNALEALGSPSAEATDPTIRALRQNLEASTGGLWNDVKGALAAVREGPRTNILDTNNLEFKKKLRILEAQEGGIQNMWKLWPELQAKVAGKVNTADLQDVTRMMYGASANLGLTRGTKDVYTGANVEYLAKGLLGLEEAHTAAEDAKFQELIREPLERATSRLHTMGAGNRVSAFVAGVGGLFDKEFQKVIGLAQGRFAKFEATDDALGLKYGPTALEGLKQRSVDRGLAQMSETIDLWTGNKSRVQDPFTVTKKEAVKIDTWKDSEGNIWREMKSGVTDKELEQRVRRQFEQYTETMGADDARKRISSDLLDQYAESRSLSTLNHPMSSEDLAARYETVRAGLKSSAGDMHWENLVANTKADPVRVAAGRHMSAASKLDPNYFKWFAKKFAPELGALAIGAGAIAHTLLSYTNGGRDTDYHSVLDFTRTGEGNASSLELSSLENSTKLREVNIKGYSLEAADADTLILKPKGLFSLGRQPMTIRMAGLDAPETTHGEGFSALKESMPGGEQAKARFQEMISDPSRIRVFVDPSDSTYGRSVGHVFRDGQNLNLNLVRQGMAANLSYKSQSESTENQQMFQKAESRARETMTGMWDEPMYQTFSRMRGHNAVTFSSLYNREESEQSGYLQSMRLAMDEAQSGRSRRMHSMANDQRAAIYNMLSLNPGRGHLGNE